MTTRERIIELAAAHEGEVVGGNVKVRINGEWVWVAKQTEGVFALTDEGVQFVQDAEAAAEKPRARKPKAKVEAEETPAEESGDAE